MIVAPGESSRLRQLDQFFLGPRAEHRQLLVDTMSLIVNDHVFWRRNFHPKDPPAIRYQSVEGASGQQWRERLTQDLFALLADLKLDVPVFSPRYMAHMVSDLSLPALIAYIGTLLYNPNNVSSEASPVSQAWELDVGRQFAALFGFDPDASFGHITSGGTVANYESLWFHKTARYLPVALELARRDAGFDPLSALPSTGLWALLNVPLGQLRLAWHDFGTRCIERGLDPALQLASHTIAWHGDEQYRRQLSAHWSDEANPPVVLVPCTAHYSWARSASLFGFGRASYWPVDVDERFGMRPDSLSQRLTEAAEQRRPVIQIVSVFGTTEYGTVDPLPEIVEVRDFFRERGLDAPIHIDAAYGGYFVAMNRNRDGSRQGRSRIDQCAAAIADCESVTVDPHKAGFTPYGAGAIVIRHGFLREVVAERAPYMDREHTDADSDSPAPPQFGRSILEGSKPGAAAAAVWFSHRMIPLDDTGYGAHLGEVCRITRALHDRILAWQADCGPGCVVGIWPLVPPQLNILCLLIARRDATRLSEANALNRLLAARFGVRNVTSIQAYDYLVSHTGFSSSLPAAAAILETAGLTADEPRVDVLRLVLLNRAAETVNSTGRTYLEDFLDTLVAESTRLAPQVADSGR